MSYNDQLNANNEALQAILNKVNNLPEAGTSSGGVGQPFETCTVTVNMLTNYHDYQLWYLKPNGELGYHLYDEYVATTNSYDVAKNTFMFLASSGMCNDAWVDSMWSASGLGTYAYLLYVAENKTFNI